MVWDSVSVKVQEVYAELVAVSTELLAPEGYMIDVSLDARQMYDAQNTVFFWKVTPLDTSHGDETVH